jgi:activator of HSP90 ATPase
LDGASILRRQFVAAKRLIGRANMAVSSGLTGAIMRRRMFLGSLFGTVIAATSAGAAPDKAVADKAKTAYLTALREEADFAAPPHRVYEALLDEKQFANFSGASAKIDRSEGGALSLFGGQIVAHNVELVPDKRIVQAWRPADWAPGIHSIVKFELTPRGAGTHLVLDHTGFPAGQFSNLDSGWHEHYLEPMKKFLR